MGAERSPARPLLVNRHLQFLLKKDNSAGAARLRLPSPLRPRGALGRSAAHRVHALTCAEKIAGAWAGRAAVQRRWPCFSKAFFFTNLGLAVAASTACLPLHRVHLRFFSTSQPRKATAAATAHTIHTGHLVRGLRSGLLTSSLSFFLRSLHTRETMDEQRLSQRLRESTSAKLGAFEAARSQDRGSGCVASRLLCLFRHLCLSALRRAQRMATAWRPPRCPLLALEALAWPCWGTAASPSSRRRSPPVLI